LPFDTTSLARFLPIFEEKLGPNVPLEINLSYRDMKFTFGADWSDNNEGEIDIDVEYILRMRVYNQTHDPLDILGYFYDEIPIKEGINLELHDDTLYGEIKYLQMNIHDRYG